MHAMPERVGGRLCLDFVNTVDPRLADERVEYLTDFDAVLDWYAASDTSLPRSITWLRRAAHADEATATQSHRRILATRESLFAVISSSIVGGTVRAGDLSRVNAALGDSIGHRVLAPSERGGVREEWRPSDSLDQVLWPVAIDAWDLLTEPELARVRQCPGESGRCGWLFLDSSRSGNRRWCDMRTCGNRAKARAHYSRRTA
jgi:predicted RNA-binding Zn ribbon-like protein